MSKKSVRIAIEDWGPIAVWDDRPSLVMVRIGPDVLPGLLRIGRSTEECTLMLPKPGPLVEHKGKDFNIPAALHMRIALQLAALWSGALRQGIAAMPADTVQTRLCVLLDQVERTGHEMQVGKARLLVDEILKLVPPGWHQSKLADTLKYLDLAARALRLTDLSRSTKSDENNPS